METTRHHNPLATQIERKLRDFGIAYDRWTKHQKARIARLATRFLNHPVVLLACKPYTKRNGEQDGFSKWNMLVWTFKYGERAVLKVLAWLKPVIERGDRWYNKFYRELESSFPVLEDEDDIFEVVPVGKAVGSSVPQTAELLLNRDLGDTPSYLNRARPPT